jgi:3-oxoacyl-[acyl-carrier protein] reductase
LVSGGSRGIGLAIVRRFLMGGARVAVLARDEVGVRHAVEALSSDFGAERILGVAKDAGVQQEAHAAVDSILEEWGAIDVSVLNAGGSVGSPGWETTPAEWEQALELNLATAARVAELVLPGMIAAGRGVLVFVASIVGLECVRAPLAYSAAKAAVVSYANSLAHEVGQHGIRVNSVAPGNVLFPGGSWDEKMSRDPARWQRYVEDEVPLQRFGSAEEIAAPVTFLASEEASFITGSCLVVDGGQTRGT